MGGECESERIKGTREESLARESYPSAEGAARPLREPLRAHGFAEPALQRTETRKPASSRSPAFFVMKLATLRPHRKCSAAPSGFNGAASPPRTRGRQSSPPGQSRRHTSAW